MLPTTSSAATTSDAPLPVVGTDTLYLLNPPHLTGMLPGGAETIRTAVPADLEYVQTGTFATYPKWSLPRPELAELAIDLRLWVEVKGTVTNPPSSVGTASGCFWYVSFFIEHMDGARTDLTNYCSSEREPPVVPAGTRLIEDSFVQTPDRGFLPGDRFGFEVRTSGAYGPDGTVEILSGTPEFDSSLTIVGLELPIDTRTLLQ